MLEVGTSVNWMGQTVAVPAGVAVSVACAVAFVVGVGVPVEVVRVVVLGRVVEVSVDVTWVVPVAPGCVVLVRLG